jgi:hypothetical protein
VTGTATESAPTPGGPPAPGIAPALIPTADPAPASVPAGAAGGLDRGLWLATCTLALALGGIAFYAKGGLTLGTMTTTEIVLTLVSAVLLAAVLMTGRRARRAYGVWPALLLLGFALLSAISIVWSVQPDASWSDAGRLLCYAAVFAAALSLTRVVPERWPAILGAIALSSVVICGYALLTKCLPDHFEAANKFARLYEPYGYWNALGLTAAMGAISCMWLGARRAGHALLSALSYPAMGVLLLTLVLAYSRGALLALAIGLVAWFCLVPLRLRGAAVLLAGGLTAGAIAAWDFSEHALSSEGVALAQRTSAGHELGALVLAMLALLTLVGIGVTFATARRAPSALLRRRAGGSLLALVAVLIVAFFGALAASHRGLTGSISHAFHTLTNTHATVPNTPGRLTAVASVRAQYWREAIKVFQAKPLLGAGADGYEIARLRYRTTSIAVKHAHNFILQTMADLGVVGLALVLLLLAAWMAAAGRATHPLNRRWPSWSEIRAGTRPAWRPLPAGEPRGYSPERIGMLSMTCVVVVFGVHSLIDWTWYVPGDAIVALICAGWLAGRGPLGRPTRARSRREALASGPPATRTRPAPIGVVAALATIALALLAAWSQWQPERSEDAREEALALVASHPRAALAAARTAVSRDPLSADALLVLADIQSAQGEMAQARATLRRAVRLQPSNPQTWLALGRFDLSNDPRAALAELSASIYLDPKSISPEAIATQAEAVTTYDQYIEALRATMGSSKSAQ